MEAKSIFSETGFKTYKEKRDALIASGTSRMTAVKLAFSESYINMLIAKTLPV